MRRAPCVLRPALVATVATVATAALAVVAPPSASATSARAWDEVFVGDYDTGDFCQWSVLQSAVRNGGACGYDQSHYSAGIGDGGHGHPVAARFELRDGDVPNFPGGERSEVRAGPAGDVVEGDERIYEFSLRFAEDFPNPTGGYMIVMQWHPVEGPPPLAVEVDRHGNLVLTNARGAGTSRTIGPIRRGEWVDYVLHVRFSDDPDLGFVEAGEDGVTTVERTPWRGMPTSSNYLKQGLYRDVRDSRTAVLWHDDLRVTAPVGTSARPS